MLIPVALSAAVVTIAVRVTEGRIATAEARAVAIGTPEGVVRDRLGPPAGHGSRSRRGERLPCLVYLGDRDVDGLRVRIALCFRDGRLAVRGRTW
jgi:hypothetical protein